MTLSALPPELTVYDPRADIIAALQKSRDVNELLDKLFGEFVKDQVITEELGQQDGSVTKAEGGLTNQDRADVDAHDLVATQIHQQLPHIPTILSCVTARIIPVWLI